MRTFSELKASARENLKGHYGACIGGMIIAGLVNNVTFNLGTFWLQYGLCKLYLNIARGEDARVGVIFDGVQSKNIVRVPLTTFLMNIFLALWSLLFIIPGIIKSFSYAQTLYVLCDDPEISDTTAIKRSMDMMEGHKGELFLLGLSFIGWILLIAVTFGLAAFYVGPYMQVTFAEYYNDLKNDYDAVNGNEM